MRFSFGYLALGIVVIFATAFVMVDVVFAQTSTMPYANAAVNVHAGPGADFAVMRTVVAGEIIPIVQISTDGQWYRLSEGWWIATYAVGNPPRPENLWPLTPIPQSAPYVEPTATLLATPVSLALPTEVPTVILNPNLAEILTVGEWSTAGYERKVATVLMWTERLARDNMISGDLNQFSVALFACVDTAIQDAIHLWGEAHLARDVAATCAFLLSSNAATTTPAPPEAVPTATPTVVYELVQPPAAATCDCDGNTLNCTEDFGGSHAAAQACFEHCMVIRGFDVHRLDWNNDGVACEELR